MTKTEIMEAIIAKEKELKEHLGKYKFNGACHDCKRVSDELDELKQRLKEQQSTLVKSTIDRPDFFEPKLLKDEIQQTRENYPKRELTEDEVNEIYNNGKSYLNDCIEKATPKLSKIKDVDKALDEIRGSQPIELPSGEEEQKLFDSLFYGQYSDDQAEDYLKRRHILHNWICDKLKRQMK